ncbi:glycosyltransferase [Vibrio cyclitrophicus]
MNVIFVGPDCEKKKISGGLRRFKEAFDAFKNVNVGAFLENKPRIRDHLFEKTNVYVAFDERYLVNLFLFLFLLVNRNVIFFPRGNKIIHYENSYSKLRLTIYRYFFSFLYSKCSILVFQTQAQYFEFEEMYNYTGRYKVLPNNINPSWMKELIQNDERSYEIPKNKCLKVGFLGGLNERKGFKVLYQSLSLYIENGRIKLSIAGEDKEKFSNFNVEALGKIFGTEIQSFYKKNDIIMIPSRYDSFPNVLLEALASGCIPLITRTPITEDILGINSKLMFDRNEESIRDIIDKIQTDDDFVRDLKMECLDLVDKYSFDWSMKIRETVLSEVSL